jgi:acetyl-CoA C-acetyltransferase
MQQDVVIVSACRTAIGKFQGTLKDTPVKELGALVGREAIARTAINPGDIDEVICGNVIQAGLGGNIARQIQGAIGVPWSVPSCTVNQLCASSMRALEIGFHSIMLGRAGVCLVVGVENMTMAPYLVLKGRSGYRMGPGTIEDSMLHDALTCAVENYHMGMTAENVASRYAISREEQDSLAVLSHQRAVKAIKEGTFKDEIVPVEVKQRKKTITFDTDEHPREGTTEEGLSALKPVFKKDGTVTAGNASGINDGAAAVVLMSSRKAREAGITPLARVIASVSAGVEPSLMGLGPAVAIPRALKQTELSFDDIDCWEVNEAFAAQFLGVQRRLKEEHGFSLDREKVNRNGSGISLGHPVGCSGLRIIVTLIHEMKKMGAQHGCASLCAGGGPAMATIIANGK